MIAAKYLLAARNEIRTAFTYRASRGGLIISACVLIALQYFIWRSVFHGVDTRAGVTLTQVVLYAVLARLWLIVLPGFRLASDLERRIRDGSIVRDLTYPASFAGVWLARSLGRSAGWFVSVALPLLVVGIVWIRPDTGMSSTVAGLISACFGYLIAFCLASFVGLSTLFLRRADGLNELRDAMSSVLGGSLVPLIFYPQSVADVIQYLPFIHVFYIPIGLLSGMSGLGWGDVAVGGVWALGLLGALVLAVRAARPRLVLEGG
jgi:ABC-2 type transport system permease protein